MNPVETKTTEELLQALTESTELLEFVPRRLLVEAVGPEIAEQFLPPLPEAVSVNVSRLLTTIKLEKPECLQNLPSKG